MPRRRDRTQGEAVRPQPDVPTPARPVVAGVRPDRSRHPGSRVYRWTSRHRQTVDVLLALALALVFLLPVLAYGDDASSGDRWQDAGWLLMAISAGLVVPLAWRRTAPVPAAAVMVAACLVQVTLGSEPVIADGLVLMMVYALAAYAPRWASIAGLWTALGGAVLFTLRYVNPFATSAWTGDPVVSAPQTRAEVTSAIVSMLVFLGFVAALVVVVWLFGDITRSRMLQQRELAEHAARLELQQTQERELAAADERARIAREMHDIVAHSLSVIITQADGARYASAADPAVTPRTLATIAETGRSSLREMRRILGVLRDDGQAETTPLPTLADLDELVATVRLSGLDVTVDTTGTPAPQRLSAGAQLVVYRVVQEALTNVLKHAGGTPHARVALDWGADTLGITVIDDGRGVTRVDLTGLAGARQGLRGMRERIELFDGALEAGPRPGGGFRVRATLPYEEESR